MPVEPGTTLGPYQVTAKIGEGGMGEVYRARDTKLDRDVALKVLPEAFTQDPDRLARFEREAKVLASLNHPNIAAIYGLEEADGIRALVLELVEGPTLADRIKQGPIPLDEALPIAKQIAEALEAAHEAGVIHRDLKPANIKVRDDGTVKVLDFGLAKALDPSPVGDPSQSPTLTAAATQMGVIMGTAAYMSPEQARGKPVDKRADIWAFGCVLYEMSTGRRAFEGEDVSVTLARVIQSEPDYSQLPNDLPVSIRRLLRRCLAKDRERRLAAAHDAILDLFDDVDESGGTIDRSSGQWRFGPGLWAIAGIVLGAALSSFILLGASGDDGSHQRATPMRFSLETPGFWNSLRSGIALDLSPDGNTLVYVISESRSQWEGAQRAGTRLFSQPLTRFVGQVISGTEGGHHPSFSPDGRWLAFSEGDRLMRVGLEDGMGIQEICQCPHNGVGVWEGNETIWLGSTDGTIKRVPAAGGEPTLVTTFDHPTFTLQLLDNNGLLFGTQAYVGGPPKMSLLSIADEIAMDMGNAGSGRVLPTGHLVFTRGGSLWAIPFDPDDPTALDAATPVVSDINNVSGHQYAISESGTLAYVPRPGSADAPFDDGDAVGDELVMVDRNGRERSLSSGGPRFRYPRFSPRGREVVVGEAIISGQVWIVDEAGRTTPLTNTGANVSPVWAVDGSRVIFSSNRGGVWNLYQRLPDGAGDAELMLEGDLTQVPTGTTHDGGVVFIELPDIENRDVMLLRPGSGVTELVVTDANERGASVSPAGDWFVYTSDESGRDEVYVQRYPDGGGKQVVSANGGSEAIWSKDGGEVFYRQGTRLMRSAVRYQPTFEVGAPEFLFETDAGLDPEPLLGIPNYDISPDGTEFVMVRSSGLEKRPRCGAELV